MTRILGDTGPAILLLPGGAEAVEGFFPGLPEALATHGFRVILHDRPGSGSSTEPASLAGLSDALHATIAGLGVGPVVAIGQSLGAAAALLLARDHPADVAGLVLLDASPITDPPLALQLEKTAAAGVRLQRVPVLGSLLRALLRSTTARSARRHGMAAPERAAALKMTDADFVQLGRAVVGFAEEALSFDPTRLPRVPAAVVTADRRPDHPIHRAHARVATALDAPLISWPGAEHMVHLTHSSEVLEVILEVLTRVRERA
ncbi:hypothetical protein GCM10027515_32250 [Schumannella luteola]|uniref:Pimeloyl-ACP methyl ester carboxylesterase n=1 Tax=Schumannella luteola TaxID=472059 RepID=A0A852YP37_9MICO|nr:alpha/beta hydrolase [Schumannella luteola]NYG98975.1 pimeloyl-ACP methyl ester carboxylesterase [Schumannella luteola]TPX06342.1 alpha/beta hydrolase [Schumannella luteola]